MCSFQDERKHMRIQTTQIGLEPTASAVTGRRSNQLSHWALQGLYLENRTRKLILQTFEPIR